MIFGNFEIFGNKKGRKKVFCASVLKLAGHGHSQHRHVVVSLSPSIPLLDPNRGESSSTLEGGSVGCGIGSGQIAGDDGGQSTIDPHLHVFHLDIPEGAHTGSAGITLACGIQSCFGHFLLFFQRLPSSEHGAGRTKSAVPREMLVHETIDITVVGVGDMLQILRLNVIHVVCESDCGEKESPH